VTNSSENITKSSTPKISKILHSLMQADFVVLLKNKRSLILSIVTPLIILLATGAHSKAQAILGGASFLIALAITIGLVSTSIFGYPINMSKDRENGVFQRLRVAPAPTWTIMFSRLLMQMLANMVISIVVLIVGQWRFNISFSIGEDILILLVSIIGGAIFLSIGQAIVGLIRSADTINATARIIYAVLILVGLLGMSGVVGNTIKTISLWSPVGTIITVFLGAMHQTTWNSNASYSLLVCFGYILVFSYVGIKWFQWNAS
jgi:ABC-2 type transport system permease protein